jgi:methanogenic corrinoid protein MtbC1
MQSPEFYLPSTIGKQYNWQTVSVQPIQSPEEIMSEVREITKALGDLDEQLTLDLVRKAIEENAAPEEILKACQDGMNEVGARFEKQEYFVSDLMVSSGIFKLVGGILDPLLKADGSEILGKVVFGTVQGDVHDIGKDIVENLLKSAGFEVIDLGVDVPPERFVEALKTSGATVLGLSGLLTLAFDSMRDTIEAVKAAGLRDKVKIMVGGGPVDATVCKSVGADDWGADPQQAIRLAKLWYHVGVSA